MEIEILGNSGGLGLGEPTTSIRIGENVLLDAGSGLESLSMEGVRKMRRVYLSHAHFDHISGLPLLIETLFGCAEDGGLEVFALPEVLDVLRAHVFNGQIWPDFTSIPNLENGFLRLTEVQPGQRICDPAGFSVVPFRTKHDVPSCGYALTFESGKIFAFTGDTGYEEELVRELDSCGAIDVLLTECSFLNRDSANADRYGHLTPELVQKVVSGLKVRPREVWLGHFKPLPQAEIRRELEGMGFSVPPAGYRREL